MPQPLDTQTVISTASKHLHDLSGHVFDLLTVTKPITPDAAVNLSKVISKLSPLLGNMIEFNTVEFLNDQEEFHGHGERERKRSFLRERKKQPCVDCGKRYPHYVMDFDHRDPTMKVFGPARATEYGWVRLREELAKCDLVCANCHRERTYGPLNRNGKSA